MDDAISKARTSGERLHRSGKAVSPGPLVRILTLTTFPRPRKDRNPLGQLPCHRIRSANVQLHNQFLHRGGGLVGVDQFFHPSFAVHLGPCPPFAYFRELTLGFSKLCLCYGKLSIGRCLARTSAKP